MIQIGENNMIRYANVKTVVVLALAISAILAATPGSLAYPQYLTNLSAVYGDGSCATCHIKTSGGGPLNSYGMLFDKQPNYDTNASAALIAIGSPPAATGTPATANLATTQTAPGFGYVATLAGLFAIVLLPAKRHHK